MRPNKIFIIALLIVSISTAMAQNRVMSYSYLMPMPASLEYKEGRLKVTSAFAVGIKGHNDERLRAAVDRMLNRLEMRTTLATSRKTPADAASAALVIECGGPGKTIPALDEDESYSLDVSGSQAVLKAATVVGAMRGLETFLQLLDGSKDGFVIQAVSIQDKPRFPWRGLMIDIARRWQPMEVIKRNLDGMAAVKLNVLHLHITDDQGFRIESKLYPKLHQMGSDGNYYTQAQMKEIIEYARMRGIRVYPEFDTPGHTTSWFVGHPELASKAGPYEIERGWGVYQPVMDPSNEAVYKLLDGFFGEMAALFPDPYLHIGGDEVEGKDWDANQNLQNFIIQKGLKDKEGLHAYYNQRLLKIVQKHGKKMIGWDEIFHPNLPKDIVIHSWRGPKSLAEAAQKGFTGILSNGYYIDLMQPTSEHYLNDPVPENTTLNEAEQKLILGGEATMWAEWTSPETIDSRIWPRTAAIAERFWSPRNVRDVADMYQRLPVISVQLEDLGLLHKKNPEAMLRRWIGTPFGGADFIVDKLRTLISLVEPVKGYRRGSMQKATQFTPMTRMVDIAQADSAAARQFASEVETIIKAGSLKDGVAASLKGVIAEWVSIPSTIIGIDIQKPNIIAEAMPVAGDLLQTGMIAQEAIAWLESQKTPSAEWVTERLSRLDEAAKPKAAVELMIVKPVRELVIAAADQSRRASMSADEWLKYVKTKAAPQKTPR